MTGGTIKLSKDATSILKQFHMQAQASQQALHSALTLACSTLPEGSRVVRIDFDSGLVAYETPDDTQVPYQCQSEQSSEQARD